MKRILFLASVAIFGFCLLALDYVDPVFAVGDWTNSTYGIDYTAGNIGIGSTAVQNVRFDLSGNLRIKGAADGGSAMTILSANGSSQKYGFSALNSGGLYFGRTAGPGSGIETDLFIGSQGGLQTKIPNNGGATLVLEPADGTSQKFGMTIVNGTGADAGLYIGKTNGIRQGVTSNIRILPNGDMCLGSGCN